jgi:hypothetical protein
MRVELDSDELVARIGKYYIGQFEKFWVLNFGIAAKAHFKKSAILLWRIHRIEWLK